MAVLLPGTGVPGTGGSTAPRSPENLEELRAWGEEAVSSDRREQLELRFAPLVDRWLRDGRTGEAGELLALWVDLDPAAAVVWRSLGDLRLEQQRFSEALEAYEEAAAHQPDVHPLGAALALWELARTEDAEAAFRKALETDPSVFARFQWARFLAWRGRVAESWRILDEDVLPVLEDRPDVLLEAAKVCSRVPSDGAPRERTPREVLAARTCSAEHAVELFREAVALLPEHSEARYGLARALQRVGDRDGARAEMTTYRRLLAADQTLAAHRGRGRARGQQAELLVREGFYEEALELLCAQDPCGAQLRGREPAELLALARALRGVGRNAEAGTVLQRLVVEAPDRTDARLLFERWRAEDG